MVKNSRGGLDRATLVTFLCIGLSSVCYIAFYLFYHGSDFSIILDQHDISEEE
jgi:hypothetical protein